MKTCYTKKTGLFQGIRGFYKGITASYMGISETVVHFVLYEGVKARLMAARSVDGVPSDQRSPRDFLEFMGAGAFSKTVASCIAYPHGKSLHTISLKKLLIILIPFQCKKSRSEANIKQVIR